MATPNPNSELPTHGDATQPSTAANVRRQWSPAFALTASTFAAFQIYTGLLGPLPGITHRATHVGFALSCVYLGLLTGQYRDRGTLWRWKFATFSITAIATTVSIAYVILNYDSIVGDPRFGYDTGQVVLGMMLVASLLIASYKTVGIVVPVLVLVGLAYPFLSDQLPGSWAAQTLNVDTVFRHLYLTAEGTFGSVTGVSAREIASFIILGTFLMATGAGAFFMGLARLLGGRARGGSAQVSLVASTFFGMINGSATANATSTGTMTIPLMIRQGFPRPFAAAVEAVASTGGQITPPVMGATAFVMAELTGASYATIAVAAIIPALAFLLCVAFGIYFHARKFEIGPMPPEEGSESLAFLSPKNIIEFVLPVALLVYMLFASGRSPALAATYSLVALVSIDILFAIRERGGVLSWMKHMATTLVAAGEAVAKIAVLVATVQILASLLTYAGLATRISSELVGLGAGAFFATLLLSMVVCTVLGMELPAVGAYVLGAAVVAPALVALGVPIIAAHMFVLFFSILAAITPPVCTTVYVTASMAQAPWLRTAYFAVILGLSAWLIPFVIVYEPGILLGIGEPSATAAIASLFLGIALVAAAGAGWCFRSVGWPIRISLFTLGLLAVAPLTWLSAITAGVAAGVGLALRFSRARPNETRELSSPVAGAESPKQG